MKAKIQKIKRMFYLLGLQIIKIKTFFSVITTFFRLKNFLLQFPPFETISQLMLRFLFVPEGVFISESSNTSEWLRRIELISNLLVTQKIKPKYKKKLDGNSIEIIEDLVKDYFNEISLFTAIGKLKNDKYDKIIINAKLFSLHVRGETYSHLLINYGKSLYSNYDEWFLSKFGFTFSEAISFTECIRDLLAEKANNGREQTRNETDKFVKELFQKEKIGKKFRKQIEISYWASIYFGKSEEFVSFTEDELCEYSKLNREKCKGFLNRLSQNFGYRSSSSIRNFRDPFKAPWDYSTLLERPIIKKENRYLVPLLPLINEILFDTFYYDLVRDEEFWKERGERIYGKWLEKQTAECFRKVFPPECVLLNPLNTKGNELCDVIILYDRKIFIVQCKTKKMTYESRIGVDFDKFKSDFEKGISAPFEQAIKAKNYLLSNKLPKLLFNDRNVTIDSNQISEIYLLCVTLKSYQNLTTRLANFESSLQISKENQYPWAISLFDLSILSEILSKPYLFIQYARRRLLLERTNFDISGDEVDLLGFYLTQGLYLNGKEFSEVNAVFFSGNSDTIDKYIFEKYEYGGYPKKPELKMSSRTKDYLEAIDNLDFSYKTDCIIRYLDMSERGRIEFIDCLEETRKKTNIDNKLHSFSTVMNDRAFGISFISQAVNGDYQKLFHQAFSFASLKKYQERCKEWIGFGCDKNSKKLIDVAFFISMEENYDSTMEGLISENLKKGYPRKMKRSKNHNK